MKTQPLERLLVYTDKKSINDFNIPEMMFDQLYELYVTTKDDILDNHHTSVDFFNEVIYYLTCIYANDDSAERLNDYLNGESGLMPSPPDIANPQTKHELNAIRNYEERNEEINEYVLLFVWVILKKQKELPKHVRFFLTALEHALEGASIYDTFKEYIQNHTGKYSISLEMKPQLTLEMKLRTAEEWQQATDDFDREVVRHIVHRFYDVGDRANVVEIIRNALNESNKNPKSHSKASMVTHRKKADDTFLDTLLKESEEEEAQRVEEVKAIEQSKDERIKELEGQVKDLKRERDEAVSGKKAAERERDEFRKRLDELNSRLSTKYIPASLKCEEAQLILNELMRKDIITPLGRNTYNEFEVQFYRWDETGALFGYFVDKMNFQLELYDTSGHINWKEFKPAFSNYDKKIKRARDTVSYYTQHPEARKPEKAEIIDNAIAIAEETLRQKTNPPQPTTTGPGLPKLPNGI